MPDHLHVVPDESSANETKAPPPWQRPIAATFDYADEHGEVLFQSVKFADSLEPRFMQRHPDGQGGWKWRLDGSRRILYRLPELVAAVADKQTIYIAEGEKDVENLRGLGLVATTNPMGAGKWRPEYSETLRSADVVIIGDNDDPGSRHVEQVSAALHGIAKRVRVLDLAKHWPQCPHKGDISDWVAAGGTADELTAVVDAAPEWNAPGDISSGDNWPVMDAAAYCGLAGDVVRIIEPHTESDPHAILIQFLVAAGNAIGRGPFYKVEGDYHFTKLNAVLVGATSDGRKGTSFGRVLQVMELADADWSQYRVQSGLVSGEGLIHHVRDPLSRLKDGEIVEVDRGVPDKRLLIDAQEFAGVLAVMEKPGNTLSPVIRDAWGHKVLQTLGKVSPDKATGSHISIIAHITESELRRKLTRTELANGFANRFLFAKVRRSKKLPHGGSLDEAKLTRLGERVKAAIENARKIGRVVMTAEAASAWSIAYGSLGDDATGLAGEVTARAAPQVIRIALIYAVQDNSTVIDLPHLKAGLAVWEFCEDSARQIFCDVLGDPVADAILAALWATAPSGMSRTDIRGLFSGNQRSPAIDAALTLLAQRRLARSEDARTTGERGRPREIWFAVGRRR
jgi:5S rRNA maturation endonuclease (ribonuclease M5)